MAQERIVQVLIIDDNQEDAMILDRCLRRCERHEVKTEYVVDLSQALEKISRRHYTVILLDNRLGGGVTAQNVLWQFREQAIDIPVIIITGTGDEQTAVELMKSGAYDYIVKNTITSESLEKTIHNTIERHLLKVKHKQAEEQIRRQKELFSNVISHIPHMVFWKDMNSIYLGCNENFARMAGVDSVEEIVGKTDSELPWEKEQTRFFTDCDDKVVKTGKNLLNIEEPCRNADGRQMTVLTSKVPLKDTQDNIIGVLGVCADITEHKRTEELLRNLNERLETTVRELSLSNRELENFAHMMAHDLKAPLRAIGTLADWVLVDGGDRLDITSRDNLKLLIQRAVRMERMIDGVLSYSRVGHDEKDEQIDLNLVAQELIKELTLKGNVHITLANELPMVFCDMTRMEQLFQNLLDNAVKYADSEDGRVEVTCVRKGKFWRFSISDNGPGIEKKYLDKIFKMFQTVPGRSDTKGTGTGVGLAIAKKIVMLYGGEMWVQSEPDKGTTFHFTLPVRETQSGDETQDKTGAVFDTAAVKAV